MKLSPMLVGSENLLFPERAFARARFFCAAPVRIWWMDGFAAIIPAGK
ncbi:hypothetical protein NB640_10800 [Oxalobacter vibrioformis]|uniref:Uncharacterized protein n=1 Tax=Oxalobacter vibrioformis TaxID=933080 RepID=A0A9E9P2A7_9BURK|nr:hypothetical protein [Oxalobacter vibrioformis]WAW09702.1 hypothetical protein NB640_10800 [Oxalobacter vibrioformis]